MIDQVLTPLPELCEFVSGGTPSRKIPAFFTGTIPWITSADLNGDVVSRARDYITKEAVEQSATKIIPKDNILLVTRTGVGKVAITGVDICISQDFTGLVLKKERIDLRYLYFFLLARQDYLVSFQRGATIQGITREVLEGLRVPLPSLPEQQRIAAILQKADRIRRLRRQARQLSDSFLQSVFLEMFGDLNNNKNQHNFRLLEELADVVSGVTKGQNYGNKETIEVPYLRVANVQDGYLDLSEIKTIRVPPAEAESLWLEKGDILMTEGGDFDKLGRGAIWGGQVARCIHQNHIFRARFNQSLVHPFFFEAFLLSGFAKNYFLGASKKTTNLASINITQLKNLPVPVPSLKEQNNFVTVVTKFNRIAKHQNESIRQAEHLFQSLLGRAFAGEL